MLSINFTRKNAFTLLLLFFFYGEVFSQNVDNPATFGIKTNDIYRILSPVKDSVIKNGQLFICVLYAKNVEINESSLKLFLDGRHITGGLRIQNHKITLLSTEILRKGAHEIEIMAKEKGFDWLKPLKWKFYVEDLLTTKEDSAANAYKRQVELTGNITTDFRRVVLHGEGADARQEPPITATANVNLNLRVGKISFPIRAFQTTDEQTYNVKGLQSRNYYSVGMVTKHLDVIAGDHNTSFDKLVMTGVRIRGAKIAIKSKRFEMTAVSGYLQRAIAGEIRKFDGKGFQPFDMKPDSTYILPGTGSYQRNVTAVRFAFGSKISGSTLGLSFLKSKDDSNSTFSAVGVKENFVFGFDQTATTNQSRLKIQMGAAMSITTNDISGGAVKQVDFENRLNTELTFDPYKFRKLITINYSTIVPGRTSTAAYMNMQFKRKINIFTLDYRYFGVGYQSFGNPFVRSDLQTASAQNQLFLWKRKITLNAKYTFQNNNLSKTAYSTIFQHFVSGSFSFIYSEKAPQFIVNYNFQSRKSVSEKYQTLGVNDQNNTLNGLILYNFKVGKTNTNLNLSYTSIVRVDKVYEKSNNNMTMYSGGVREYIKAINTTFDFQYSRSDLKDLNGHTPVSQSYDTRIRYQQANKRNSIGVGYTINEMLMTRFGAAKSRRYSYSLLIGGQLSKAFTFDLEAGGAPFTSTYDKRLNYTEFYFYTRFSYNIGTFLKK